MFPLRSAKRRNKYSLLLVEESAVLRAKGIRGTLFPVSIEMMRGRARAKHSRILNHPRFLKNRPISTASSYELAGFPILELR